MIFGVNADADLGFYSKRTVKDAEAFLPGAEEVNGDIVASIIELGRWDVERRQFLASSTFALGALSVPDLDSLIRPTRAAATGRTVRVGRGEVMAVRRMTTVLGDAAAELGGGHARHLTVSYLINDVAPWLNGDYSEATGRELFAATSQLVHLAGWMAQDEGEQALAHSYYAHSFRLAHEAGNGELALSMVARFGNHSGTDRSCMTVVERSGRVNLPVRDLQVSRSKSATTPGSLERGKRPRRPGRACPRCDRCAGAAPGGSRHQFAEYDVTGRDRTVIGGCRRIHPTGTYRCSLLRKRAEASRAVRHSDLGA